MTFLNTIKKVFGARSLGAKAVNSLKLRKTLKSKKAKSVHSLGAKAVNSLKLRKTLKSKQRGG
jgi:hypothetical protein